MVLGPNGRPQQMFTTAQQIAIQRISRGLQECPAGCTDALIQAAIPKELDRLKAGAITAWARCIKCLSYWEVDFDGRVVRVLRFAPVSETRPVKE